MVFPFIIIHVPTIHIEHSFDKKAPVANSGVAGGACVIAVAAAPVAMQGRGEGKEKGKETSGEERERREGEKRGISPREAGATL